MIPFHNTIWKKKSNGLIIIILFEDILYCTIAYGVLYTNFIFIAVMPIK